MLSSSYPGLVISSIGCGCHEVGSHQHRASIILVISIARLGKSGRQGCEGDQSYDREFAHCRSALRPERRYLMSAAAERTRTTTTRTQISPIANIIPGIIPSIMVRLV